MPTFTSLKQYRNVIGKRLKALKRLGNQSALLAAKRQILQAKKTAPRSTGETIRGMRKRKLKSGIWIAESIVSAKGKGFRQNMWANRTPPHDKPILRWSKGKPVVYGMGHRTTGMPRFWDRATIKTRRAFNRIGRRNTIKALRISA